MINCVLLVDDNEADNEFHSFIIEESNMVNKIVTALNGQEALDHIMSLEPDSDERPDLVFLDINMPVMNGFEFLEEYQKIPAEKKSGYVIVMLTTSLLDSDREKAASYGNLADFVKKPLTEEYLLETIKKHFPEI